MDGSKQRFIMVGFVLTVIKNANENVWMTGRAPAQHEDGWKIAARQPVSRLRKGKDNEEDGCC